MQNGIILDGRRIKAYEGLLSLGEYAGFDEPKLNELWQEFVAEDRLMTEFMYYLDHHSLKDSLKCEGYGLTDLYVHRINVYNIAGDIGKNTSICNKETMILEAFSDMAKMLKDPGPYLKHLGSDFGMDRGFN